MDDGELLEEHQVTEGNSHVRRCTMKDLKLMVPNCKHIYILVLEKATQ